MSLLSEKYSGRQLEMRQAVLNMLIKHVVDYEYSPSYRELRDRTDVGSISTVHRYLDEFHDLGFINMAKTSDSVTKSGTKRRKPNRSISLNWDLVCMLLICFKTHIMKSLL